MTDTRRDSPYVWVTHVTAHLAGDRACDFAPWYKAHFKYEKRPDDGGFDFKRWKADHAEAVRDRVETLRGAGYEVLVEGTNKFRLQGSAVTIGGQPDIVAIKPGEFRAEDAKTGGRRDADAWQVMVYLVALDLLGKIPSDAKVSGGVIYSDGIEEVPAPTPEDRQRIYDFLAGVVGAGEPPVPVPSAGECRFCDIASCRDRTESETTGQTEKF